VNSAVAAMAISISNMLCDNCLHSFAAYSTVQGSSFKRVPFHSSPSEREFSLPLSYRQSKYGSNPLHLSQGSQHFHVAAAVRSSGASSSLPSLGAATAVSPAVCRVRGSARPLRRYVSESRVGFRVQERRRHVAVAAVATETYWITVAQACGVALSFFILPVIAGLLISYSLSREAEEDARRAVLLHERDGVPLPTSVEEILNSESFNQPTPRKRPVRYEDKSASPTEASAEARIESTKVIASLVDAREEVTNGAGSAERIEKETVKMSTSDR